MTRSTFLHLLLAAPLAGPPLFAAGPAGGSALDFLLARQSPDGAWRSTTYGAFRSGHALTPLIVRCLSLDPENAAAAALEKAARWLVGERDQVLGVFPVHNAAFILEAAARLPALEALRTPAIDRLLALRSPRDGGWSYSPLPPPADPDEALAPMQHSNLSATAIALDGLHAADAISQEVMASALEFIRSCQNHGDDPAFDDGGFFQLPDDPARNKAGRAGTDRHGRVRYHSYTAATADGLRALLGGGDPRDADRIAAATHWLRDASPAFPPDLFYYACRSLAALHRMTDGAIPCPALLALLASRRRSDGSWRNPAPEMRENCPLVATALALEALALLKREAAKER